MIRLYGRSVFASVSRRITPSTMVESVLRSDDVRLFALPDSQGRLLNCAAKGE
jgi:hypothetical protein